MSEQKMITTGDPVFVNFCGVTAIHTQIRLYVDYYAEHSDADDARNVHAALLSAQNAVGFVVKALATQIFEPLNAEINGKQESV